MLNIYFKLLQIFYTHSDFVNNSFSSNYEFQNSINTYSLSLKDIYHEFTNIFSEYNLKTKQGLNILYKKKIFLKIRGFWEEAEYESNFSSELDYIIYNLLNLNMVNQYNNTNAIIEGKNFIFFKERKDATEKPTTKLTKLLFYFFRNYEFLYRQIFNDIETTIYNSFLNYITIYLNINFLYSYYSF